MMTRASNSKTTPKFPGMRLQKDSPKSVVCSRFFGAQIINISHVRTPSGRDEDHLQRRQRPVSYILMVCLNHYQFFVSEIRFAPISMCWFVFIQFVLWLCWSQGPKTPRTLLFFPPGALPKLLGSRWDFCDVLASLENLFLFRHWKKWWESGFVRGGKELCLWQLLASVLCDNDLIVQQQHVESFVPSLLVPAIVLPSHNQWANFQFLGCHRFWSDTEPVQARC